VNSTKTGPLVNAPLTVDPLTYLRWHRGPAAVGIHRPPTGRLRIVMPYARGTRAWLRSVCGAGTRPEWDPGAKVWTVARTHFRAVTEAVARFYGTADVWLDVSVRHQCDQRCRDATGDECSCECGGEHHGGAGYQRAWTQVGDTLISNQRVRRHYVVNSENAARVGAV
jgi:hypothetical protein